MVAFAHCPFRELAEEHPELVCALHRGLVEGFVEAVGGGEVDDFHTSCTANLARSCSPPDNLVAVITLTDSAASKVKELLDAEGEPELALRVAVRPGGCSGFSYEMFFDGDVAGDDEQAELRRREGRRRPVERAAAQGRHARLQGRPPERRVRHRQPERHPQLRLRPVLQLMLPAIDRRRSRRVRPRKPRRHAPRTAGILQRATLARAASISPWSNTKSSRSTTVPVASVIHKHGSNVMS